MGTFKVFMYPPQTSLIPVTVALARFIESHGFTGDYPFWYLGVPLKYLTGPIIPFLLTGFHRIFPSLSFFDLSYLLIFLSFALGALGWGILAGKLSQNKKVGLIMGILFLILPWKWLSALALSETSAVVAINFLPVSLLALGYYQIRPNLTRLIIAMAAISTVLLIYTGVTSTLIVGMVALSLATTNYIKRLLIILIFAILIATIWYTPLFWWTLLVNPSIGGKAGFQVIWRIFDLSRVFIPLILAVLAVYFWGKTKSRYVTFCLAWILTFVFLTVYRFLSNPQFWQDWTSWLFELEIGLGLILAKLLGSKLNRNIKIYIVILSSILLVLLITASVYRKLRQPVLISSSKPVIARSLEELNKIAGGQTGRVFLSGSTVFWANSLYDLYQVRGGRDEVSTNPGWLKAAYEIREGDNPDLTLKALRDLDVSYVLVHTDSSGEYYHDFKNLEKWDQIGRKNWEGEGDVIYQIDY